MAAKTRPKSRIPAAVHATASDLRSAGFIDKRRMREYDARCLAPVRPYSSRKIRALTRPRRRTVIDPRARRVVQGVHKCLRFECEKW